MAYRPSTSSSNPQNRDSDGRSKKKNPDKRQKKRRKPKRRNGKKAGVFEQNTERALSSACSQVEAGIGIDHTTWEKAEAAIAEGLDSL